MTAIKQMFALHHIKTSENVMHKSIADGDTLYSLTVPPCFSRIFYVFSQLTRA